jgi:phosphohistidine phosphatase SixA
LTVTTNLRAIAAMAAILFFGSATAGAQTPAISDLAGRLRQGGYVLVMRHADAPAARPDKASADSGNAALERQLSASGRAAAEKMGEAIAALHIPVGDVFTSPTFRARQTVTLLALNGAKTEALLDEGEQGMAGDADANRAAWLKKAAATAPRAGRNTVIVTHAPNLHAAFGATADGIAAGETMVFRPDGKGASTFIARVKPDEWSAIGASR